MKKQQTIDASQSTTLATVGRTAQRGLPSVRAVLNAACVAVFVASVTSPTFTSTSVAASSSSSSPQQSGSQYSPGRVNFTDCGSRNVKEVRIFPCAGDANVCQISLGTNVTVEADFIAKQDASSLNELIKGVVRGRELQFPEQRSDPCKTIISPNCPIKTGKFYQYKATFEIKPYYPAIPVKIRYALANPAGDIVVCVQISAKIIDPSPSVRSLRNNKLNKKKAT